MTIYKVDFVDETGIPGLASPIMPYTSGKTDADSYIKRLIDTIDMYTKEIVTKLDVYIYNKQVTIKVAMWKADSENDSKH